MTKQYPEARPLRCAKCNARSRVYTTEHQVGKCKRYRKCPGCGEKWITIEVNQKDYKDLVRRALIVEGIAAQINTDLEQKLVAALERIGNG